MERFPEFNQYEVSTNGEIRSKRYSKLLKPKDTGSVLAVTLIHNDKGRKTRKTVRVNRVVLQVFKPNPSASKMYAAFKDKNYHNNTLSNLEWRTPKQSSLNQSRRPTTQVVLTQLENEEKVATIHCSSIKECLNFGTEPFYWRSEGLLMVLILVPTYL